LLNLKLKCLPTDFIVNEVIAFNSIKGENLSDAPGYEYYVMSKLGYTTMEALSLIASQADIPVHELGYSGLKDEDGFTTQYISVSTTHADKLRRLLNEKIFIQPEKFISLNFFSYSNKALKIGQLIGNAFSIKVRNLPKEFVSYLKKNPVKHFNFLNYYGKQRFSVPDGPLNTHLIGNFLYQKDYKAAILELAKQPSELGHNAKQWSLINKDDAMFFEGLDKRIQAFFMSSYFSFSWNNQLKSQLDSVQDQALWEFDKDLSLHFNTSLLYNQLPETIPYVRVEYNYDQGHFEEKQLHRSTVIQTSPIIQGIEDDILHPNMACLSLDFFLPSGCYATVFVPQFLESIYQKHLRPQYIDV
jgi:tRNA pseudouridine13 synthase